MKLKKKIYPSPSPSSSSSSSTSSVGKDYLSVLKLLPAAILALASVLSAEDSEVLAYMITRSLQTTTTTNPSSIFSDSKKKSSKKTLAASGAAANNKGNGARHNSPVFDCDCFDCYTSYWLRWDSSPNRERIHQVIEAFEDHLTNGETKKSKSSRTKKGRRSADNLPQEIPEDSEPISSISAISSPAPPVAATLPVVVDDALVSEKATEEQDSEVADMTGEFQAEIDEEAADARTAAAASNHKGLARKVLPDLLGLFNSRLWNLWSPHV